jgi:hypothetical protein
VAVEDHHLVRQAFRTSIFYCSHSTPDGQSKIGTKQPPAICKVEQLGISIGSRMIHIPWEDCSKKLAAAMEQERLNAELSPGGYGIHWPLIDEDLSISGLLRRQGKHLPDFVP